LPINYDALNRAKESRIETTNNSIGFEWFSNAIKKTLELSIGGSFSNISSKSGSSKVQWVDDCQTGSSGGSSSGQITGKKLPKLLILVNTIHKHLLVCILEGEIQGLSGEISDHIDNIAAPETEETLFFMNSGETIDHTLKIIKKDRGSAFIIERTQRVAVMIERTLRAAIMIQRTLRAAIMIEMLKVLLAGIWTLVRKDPSSIPVESLVSLRYGWKSSRETNEQTFVLLILCDKFRSILNLKQNLDTLKWSYDSFGNGGRNATGQEIQHEISTGHVEVFVLIFFVTLVEIVMEIFFLCNVCVAIGVILPILNRKSQFFCENATFTVVLNFWKNFLCGNSVKVKVSGYNGSKSVNLENFYYRKSEHFDDFWWTFL
jgi:hypothetical protein